MMEVGNTVVYDKKAAEEEGFLELLPYANLEKCIIVNIQLNTVQLYIDTYNGDGMLAKLWWVSFEDISPI